MEFGSYSCYFIWWLTNSLLRIVNSNQISRLCLSKRYQDLRTLTIIRVRFGLYQLTCTMGNNSYLFWLHNVLWPEPPFPVHYFLIQARNKETLQRRGAALFFRSWFLFFNIHIHAYCFTNRPLHVFGRYFKLLEHVQ